MVAWRGKKKPREITNPGGFQGHGDELDDIDESRGDQSVRAQHTGQRGLELRVELECTAGDLAQGGGECGTESQSGSGSASLAGLSVVQLQLTTYD